MANRSATPEDLGFDPDVARERLVQWLLSEGVVTAEDLASGDTSDPWAVGYAAAVRHLMEHHGGIVDAPSCQMKKCKKRGLSLALLELHAHAKGESEPATTLAEAEELVDEVRRLSGERVADIRRRILEQLRELDPTLSAPWLQAHPLVQTLARLDAIQYAVNLSSHFDVPHLNFESLAIPERIAEGRKPGSLLGAVWRHLTENGFSRAEAAALVPDLQGMAAAPADVNERVWAQTEKAKQLERVRGRVQSTDHRFFPGWQNSQ